MSRRSSTPRPGRDVPGFEFTDITYHRAVDTGRRVRVAFNRPETAQRVPARTPSTSCIRALDHARMTTDIGCVLLTGNGPSPKDGGWAFCSGGDQRIRGRDGYRYADRRHGRHDRSRPRRVGSTSSKSSA